MLNLPRNILVKTLSSISHTVIHLLWDSFGGCNTKYHVTIRTWPFNRYLHLEITLMLYYAYHVGNTKFNYEKELKCGLHAYQIALQYERVWRGLALWRRSLSHWLTFHIELSVCILVSFLCSFRLIYLGRMWMAARVLRFLSTVCMTRWSSQRLALAWHSTGCLSHLGN